MSPSGKAWLALAVPPVTWFVFEQGLSALLHADCSRTAIGTAWGVISLCLCALAVRIGWPLRQAHDPLVSPWIARLTIAVGGIFGLAIAFQTLAILIVPACVR